jgi:hypothetical protein
MAYESSQRGVGERRRNHARMTHRLLPSLFSNKEEKTMAKRATDNRDKTRELLHGQKEPSS